jgi:hypothetical protein
VRDPEAVSYVPVIAVFAAAAALALAASFATTGEGLTGMAGEWFVAFAMVILAMLKLQDLDPLRDDVPRLRLARAGAGCPTRSSIPSPSSPPGR